MKCGRDPGLWLACRYHCLIDSCYDPAWSDIASIIFTTTTIVFGVWFSKRNSQSHIGQPWNQSSPVFCIKYGVVMCDCVESGVNHQIKLQELSLFSSCSTSQTGPLQYIGMLTKYEYTVNTQRYQHVTAYLASWKKKWKKAKKHFAHDDFVCLV